MLRISRGLLFALAGLAACGRSASDDSGAPTPNRSIDRAGEASAHDDASSALDPSPRDRAARSGGDPDPADAAAVERASASDDAACDVDVGATPDLVTLAAVGDVCPSRAGERRVQRARLLLAATRGDLAHVAPTLEDAELAALARLLLREAGPSTAIAIEPLETARFVPIDEDVLARARGAWAMLEDASDSTDDRTRAEAWLAEAHLAALLSLGVPRDQPAPPFVRLLGARALDHGRRFVTRWVQRRVEGTEGAVRRVEHEMEQLVAWLDADPGFGDPPEVAWALELARDHLRTASSRARRSRARVGASAAKTTSGPEQDLPWLGELERRIAAGMIPRALSRGRSALSTIPASERESALLAMALVLRRWGVDPNRLARGAADPLRILRDDLGERLDAETAQGDDGPGDGESPSALVPEAVVMPTPRRVVAPSWLDADAAATSLVAQLRACGEVRSDAVACRRARSLAQARPDAVARALDVATEDSSLARWRPWLLAWWAVHPGPPPSRGVAFEDSTEIAPTPYDDASASAPDAHAHRRRLANAANAARQAAGRR